MPEDRFTSEPPAALGPALGPALLTDRRAAPTAAPPGITWAMSLSNVGIQLLVALVAGLVCMIVLLFLDSEGPVARGSGVVTAIIALWVARSLVHWPIPKAALASRHQMPPNVRASETGGREAVETAVFVVVLVLLLKSFAAEAFVIPTGSMAETLYGYQKIVKCPSCGHEFPVNCSSEVDPQEGPPQPVNGCTCPNCRRVIRLVDPNREGRQPRAGILHDSNGEFMEIRDPGWSSGDRVLVGKFLYDAAVPGLKQPSRLDVVVFKYPDGPQKNGVAMNYIKRLIGMPGETIAISGGDIYELNPEKSPKFEDQPNADGKPRPVDLWKPPFMHIDDNPAARELFAKGKFDIVRKSPRVLLSMMRLVYDNDHPADDLLADDVKNDTKKWQRWLPKGEAWETREDGRTFRHSHQAEASKSHNWLHYRHRPRDKGGRDTLITDVMGYNTAENLIWNQHNGLWSGGSRDVTGVNWVGDLILECQVNVEKADGELVLELVRSGERFRATWDLGSAEGLCTLSRIDQDGKATPLSSKRTRLRRGTHRLRFANVDRQLQVWVDNTLPFEQEKVTWQSGEKQGPTDLDAREPASIGVKNAAVTVRKIKLYRDSYFCLDPSKGDVQFSSKDANGDRASIDWANPNTWGELQTPPVKTLYVQPQHFLCLGDNSLASSDGRSWGLVPQRLMLGRALMVYWPASRAGRIR